MKKSFTYKIVDNFKTILIALFIALIIRTLFFQPFYIPSSSMEPTLLVGDRLFVSKYSYGYSKHSLPFSPPIFTNRFLNKLPERGDVVVFKTPSDNRTDYIKRLIGLPGDKIQFIDGFLFINNKKVNANQLSFNKKVYCGNGNIDVNFFEETLSNGKKYIVAYKKKGSYGNTDPYIVPEKHLFFLGDNRDCSKDSRYLTSVGYVNEENLVGKARILFFSNDIKKSSLIKFWNVHQSLRYGRFFKKIE